MKVLQEHKEHFYTLRLFLTDFDHTVLSSHLVEFNKKRENGEECILEIRISCERKSKCLKVGKQPYSVL